MVQVAVAGGLGNVGRTIVDVLTSSPKHNVIVLSRKASDDAGAPVVTVDYSDIDSMKQVLESNKVEVVISAVMVNDEQSFQSEINLIKAADKSSSTTRFVVSEFGIPYGPREATLMPHLKLRLDAREELEKTDLEWTRFQNGFFLDYFGLPHIKSYQLPLSPFLDIEAKMAVIPGDGNTPTAFTYTFDVARFVVAALDLPEWKSEYVIVGDKLTWNELLKHAEEVRGSKFEVHFDSIDKLKSGQTTELAGYAAAYESFLPKEKLLPFLAIFGVLFATGAFDLETDTAMNHLFPEIKPMTARELLEHAWRGR